jgi:primosomal protein N' (replication factor Y) (superfamily II helicase)
MRLIRVAVPVPALEALTYSVPEELGEPSLGARVLVPLGNRTLTGVVIEPALGIRDSRLGNTTDETMAPESGIRDAASDRTPEPADPESRIPNPGTVKSVLDVLDASSFLPADVVALAAWVSEYYACGAGEAIAAAMPPRAWVESERYAQMTAAGGARLPAERGMRREILDALAVAKPVRVDTILGRRRGSHAALLDLERDGLVEMTRPLKGKASAYRTVRVATLSAQGHDVAEGIGAVHPKGSGADVDGPNDTRGASSPVSPGAGQLPTATGADAQLGARQREALALLKSSPDGIDTAALDGRGIGAATLKRLAALGLIVLSRRRVDRDPFEQGAAMASVAREPLVLTDEQAAAFERLRALAGGGGFQTALLHGVTGSGKTELYLRLADTVRRSGRGVLMLVPEIALTPAVAAVFRATFGDRVAIQHSGLSDGERHDQWQRIRRGDVDVVVGTRSAVFAPLRSLGLIIVDEEHDGSYKQEESPRYHGRDVAIVRGRQAGALVVLGSATPSLESFHNAQNGRYILVALERRVLDRPMAAVRIVDMREEYAVSGPDVILSGPLCDALGDRLERREQSIVLLNRRGFATSVFCRECASTLECPNCSVSLTVHRAARRARCHYCNHAAPLPKTCAKCAGPFLEQLGFGTERVEAEIVARFPGIRVTRVDRDTIRRRGAIVSLLSRFAAGEIDVLVGTQMIAKGHDFPRVTLVGVISADVGLGLADFRAAERTFQLLTQVAGRAGRGEIRGEALVQTLYPRHYSIRHACRQDYAAFYEEEIGFRRGMRYPPSVALINTIVRARTREAAMADAGELVQALRLGGEPYRVLGPAPAPLSRLKGEHRAQFFIKGTHRPTMRKALQMVLASRPEIRRRTIVDVDPMSVL